MEIHLLKDSPAYGVCLFSNGTDGSPGRDAYLYEAALFALTALGGKRDVALQTWAGEPWSTAKGWWEPKQISRRHRR